MILRDSTVAWFATKNRRALAEPYDPLAATDRHPPPNQADAASSVHLLMDVTYLTPYQPSWR